jgi:hypothetical protein
MLKSKVSAIMADNKVAVLTTLAAQREEPGNDVWLGVVALCGHQKVIRKNVPGKYVSSGKTPRARRSQFHNPHMKH